VVRAAERSAGRRGSEFGEHRGLALERLLVAVEGIAVGQLAGVLVGIAVGGQLDRVRISVGPA
jgi:hypothetical protein